MSQWCCNCPSAEEGDDCAGFITSDSADRCMCHVTLDPLLGVPTDDEIDFWDLAEYDAQAETGQGPPA